MINYNGDSIVSLSPLEGIRKNLGMYAGSYTNSAITHTVKELLSNSIDEYLQNHGNEIFITLYNDNKITIEDRGRGIPINKIEDVFTKTHTGSKFRGTENKSYQIKAGTHGVGAKLSASIGLTEVEVVRDGKKYNNWFSYQAAGEATIITSPSKFSYTKITWTPDEGVVDDNTIYESNIIELVQDLSYVAPGLKFILKTKDGKSKTFESRGIKDFISDSIDSKSYLSNIMCSSEKNQAVETDFCMVWTKGVSLEKSYANLVPTLAGTHITTFKTVLTRELNKLLKSDLKGEEIRNNLSFVISIKTSKDLTFTGQSKEKLDTPELRQDFSTLFSEGVHKLFNNHKDFFISLKNAIVKQRKKDTAEVLMRELTAKKPAHGLLKELSDKYKGCTDQTNIELFITEGDSAAGGLHITKNHKNQAVYGMRGKPQNTFSQSMEKVLQNKEIKGLIEILGTESQALKKFDKIVLTADADPDGVAIVNLLLGFFATFYKELLIQGKIFFPLLPKYMAQSEKGEIKFLETEAETAKLPKSWDITYLKGLGQMSPKDLSRFTVNTSTRNLTQLKLNEDEFENFYESLKLALSKEKEDIADRRELLI